MSQCEEHLKCLYVVQRKALAQLTTLFPCHNLQRGFMFFVASHPSQECTVTTTPICLLGVILYKGYSLYILTTPCRTTICYLEESVTDAFIMYI
jgi:hypothetical protein